MKQHPISACWRRMQEGAFAELVDDIRANGQLEPGVVLEGLVLDGWNRYLACVEAGIEFRSEPFVGFDPYDFVMSKNKHRRHESQTEVALSAAKMEALKVEKGGESATVADLAQKSGVGKRTMERATAVVAADLADVVESGRFSLSEAAKVAALPKAKRKVAVAAIKAGEPIPPKPKPEPKPDPRDAQIAMLEQRVDTLETEKAELAEASQEVQDKLTVFQTTEPDEQQKLIAELQKQVVKLEAERDRLRVDRQGWMNKFNDAARTIKALEKRVGKAA